MSVKGNTLPASFFVMPGSRRTSRALRSTLRHSSGRTSLCTRHPVTYANRATGRSDFGNLSMMASIIASSTKPVLTLRSCSSRIFGIRPLSCRVRNQQTSASFTWTPALVLSFRDNPHVSASSSGDVT